MIVADKFPNGLIGLIGPNRPQNSTSISTTKFVVRRAPSATLGKNATDG